MAYQAITYTVEEGIATITLNRPDARNGYTHRMADDLAVAYGTAGADDAVKVVVLTGAGSHFCVGMDMSSADGADDHTSPDWVEPATRACKPMWQLTKPIIAAVQGAAVGVGSTMLLPADIRIAASSARFGFVFGRRGMFPEGGSMWFLPRIVGLGRAMEWMITGRLIPATEALSAGLVTAVYEPDELLPKAYELAREIVANVAPVSMAVIRQGLLTMQGEPTPDLAFALDSRLIAHAFSSADAAEGIMAFLQKRVPHFPGAVSTDLPPFLPWISR